MRSELPRPWLVPQQEQLGRYLGSEQIKKPSPGKRNSAGICLLANLFLTLSATTALGTPSVHTFHLLDSGSPLPSACRAIPLRGVPRIPEPLILVPVLWEDLPGTWWRKVGARCMAAGQGGAALPAGPRWTGHLPGWRGWSWLQVPLPALRGCKRRKRRVSGASKHFSQAPPVQASSRASREVSNMHWDHFPLLLFHRCTQPV